MNRLVYAAPALALVLVGCQLAPGGAARTSAPPSALQPVQPQLRLCPSPCQRRPHWRRQRRSHFRLHRAQPNPHPHPRRRPRRSLPRRQKQLRRRHHRSHRQRLGRARRSPGQRSRRSHVRPAFPIRARTTTKQLLVVVQTGAGAEVTVTAHYKSKDTVHTAMASPPGRPGYRSTSRPRRMASPCRSTSMLSSADTTQRAQPASHQRHDSIDRQLGAPVGLIFRKLPLAAMLFAVAHQLLSAETTKHTCH